MKALQIAATGMLAQERRTEIVANNLANMNTNGYQKRRVEFNSLIYKTSQRPSLRESSASPATPAGVHSGLGVQAAATYRVSEPGFLRATDNPLDISIEGRGYFQILKPNGEQAYTRDGNFQIGPQGQLVTADGYAVQPGITLPPNAQSITVNKSGAVVVKSGNQDTPVTVGNLQVALFPNEGGMDPLGQNLFSATEQSGEPIIVTPGEGGAGNLAQGFVEASNVNPIEEISNLIKAHRAYEMNSKVMATADQMKAPIGAK